MMNEILMNVQDTSTWTSIALPTHEESRDSKTHTHTRMYIPRKCLPHYSNMDIDISVILSAPMKRRNDETRIKNSSGVRRHSRELSAECPKIQPSPDKLSSPSWISNNKSLDGDGALSRARTRLTRQLLESRQNSRGIRWMPFAENMTIQ